MVREATIEQTKTGSVPADDARRIGEVATDSAKDAYAGRPPIEPARLPWPLV